MADFTKLSSLVGGSFTVTGVQGYKFKKWDDTAKQMLSQDTPSIGYRKLYQVVTDKGLMDLGTGQMGNLFESVSVNGKSDILGRTFNVASNGKQGMEIRYYLNPQPLNRDGIDQTPHDSVNLEDIDTSQPVNMSEIPF